jgi:hypothetical protein
MTMRDQQRIEREMVDRLGAALGAGLVSVVLYGPEAHDDDYGVLGSALLMIVVADLEPATLRRLADPVRWWLRRRQPWPRLFTLEMVRDVADVYPIELLDIVRHHRILHGPDPVAAVTVNRAHLRLQCERELREKLMRLREGYVECHGRTGALVDLLAVSFASFAQVFRGGLQLLGVPVPRHDRDVMAALGERLDLPHAAFARVERLAAGASDDADAVFADYYRALSQAVVQIDRLFAQEGTRS